MGEKLSNIKEGTESFIANWNNFFDTCEKVGSFIGNCITQEGYLISIVKDVAPDIILIVLLALVILRVLGFKETEKYILLTLVIALIIALL